MDANHIQQAALLPAGSDTVETVSADWCEGARRQSRSCSPRRWPRRLRRTTAATPRTPADSPPLEGASRVDFPQPSNRSMSVLIAKCAQGPRARGEHARCEPGRNRFGFGLFDRGNRQIGGLEVGPLRRRGPRRDRARPICRALPPDRRGARVPQPEHRRRPGRGALDIRVRGAVPAPGQLPGRGRREAERPAWSDVADAGDGRRRQRMSPPPGDKAIRVHTPTEEIRRRRPRPDRDPDSAGHDARGGPGRRARRAAGRWCCCSPRPRSARAGCAGR